MEAISKQGPGQICRLVMAGALALGLFSILPADVEAWPYSVDAGQSPAHSIDDVFSGGRGLPRSYDDVPRVELHPCTKVEPHIKFDVPMYFGSTELPSGSGFYHYTGTNSCDRWVVDIRMFAHSNENCNYYNPAPGELCGPGRVVIGAHPHDLPSSISFGGTIPTTEEDCLSYELDSTIYRKAPGEQEFSVWQNHWKEGQWDPYDQECTITHQSDNFPLTDDNEKKFSIDLYRVAVKLILRDSAQQVKVRLTDPPPN